MKQKMENLNEIDFRGLILDRSNIARVTYCLIIFGLILSQGMVSVSAADCTTPAQIFVLVVNGSSDPTGGALVFAFVGGEIVDTKTSKTTPISKIGEAYVVIPMDKFTTSAASISVNITAVGGGYYGSALKTVGCGATPETNPLYITLDTPELVPPNINSVTVTPNMTSGGVTVTVTVNATDIYDSNLTVTLHVMNGTNEIYTENLTKIGATDNYTINYNAPTSTGTYTINITAADDSGNSDSDASETLTVDATPPVTDDNAPSGWQNTNFDITLTCNDANGCSSTQYRINGGAWTTGTTISITTEGNHTIEYNSTDNAGNVEATHTIYAALDKTLPTTTDNAPSGWQTTNFDITLNCNDATSGCDVVAYRINGGACGQQAQQYQ